MVWLVYREETREFLGLFSGHEYAEAEEASARFYGDGLLILPAPAGKFLNLDSEDFGGGLPLAPEQLAEFRGTVERASPSPVLALGDRPAKNWLAFRRGELLGQFAGFAPQEIEAAVTRTYPFPVSVVPTETLLTPEQVEAFQAAGPLAELPIKAEADWLEPAAGHAVTAEIVPASDVPPPPPLALNMAPELYSRVRGAACTVIVVGDLGRFERNLEGVRVRFKDPELRYQGGRPEGNFLLDQFADRAAALEHARRVAAGPLGLIRREGSEFLTTRGWIHVNRVVFADGGKAPKIPDETVWYIRTGLAHNFGIAWDSEGLAVGPEPRAL